MPPRPKNGSLPGRCGADAARHRQVAPFEQRVADAREREERPLADDRVVPLQHVLVVRIPPVAADVRVVAAHAVSIPVRHRQVPAIGHRQEDLLARRERRRRIALPDRRGGAAGCRTAIGGPAPSGVAGAAVPHARQRQLDRHELRAPRRADRCASAASNPSRDERDAVLAGRDVEEAEDAVGAGERPPDLGTRDRSSGVAAPPQLDLDPGTPRPVSSHHAP